MMSTVLIIVGIDIFLGSLYAGWWDDQEMKKHVPYGDLPSILPLHAIRMVTFAVMSLVFVPLCLTGVIIVAAQTAYSRLRFHRALWSLGWKLRKASPETRRFLREVVKKARR